MTRVSRRDFVRLGAAGTAAVPLVRYPIPVHGADTRAQQVVERIRTSLATEWRADTVDTFKAGDPSTVVSGIVTTSLATLDVMRRAVKAGANMIITSGPTFYSRADRPTPPTGRGRGAPATPPPPDPDARPHARSAAGLPVCRQRARGLDAKYETAPGSHRFTIPETTLGRLATDVKKRTGARTPRGRRSERQGQPHPELGGGLRHPLGERPRG